MTTKASTRKAGSKPRSFRILALIASLSLAMAGLVGLGFAPAASAAPTCPADYELIDGTCYKYVDATLEYGEYYCEVGQLVNEDECKLPDGKEYTDATKGPDTYNCLAFPGTSLNGTKCEKPADIPDGYSCPEDQTLFNGNCYDWVPCAYDDSVSSDTFFGCCVDNDSVSTETFGRGCWEKVGPATPKFKCAQGWDKVGSMCQKNATKVPGQWTCPEGWTGPIWPAVSSDVQTDTQVAPKCERPKYKYVPADRDSEWTCPEGSNGPFWGDEVYDEAINYEGPYCVFTKIPTDSSFSASASAQAGATVCVNNAQVGVGAIGSGSAGSTSSQADAQTKAQAAANANAAANLAAQISKVGGTTSGSCGATPPVVSSATVAPVTAPAAATVAAPAPAKVSAPAPATVSAGVATVSAPSKATLPSSVPAGDGSQSPVLPVWALALIAVGVLGAAAAGKQLVSAKK